MKINITRVSLAIAIAIVCLVDRAEGQCTTASVAGSYAVDDSGWVIGSTPSANQPRDGVSLIVLDGAGNITGSVTASLNGVTSQVTLKGTYTVNGHCTGSSTFSEYNSSGVLVVTASINIVFYNNGNAWKFIFTSATLRDGTSLPVTIDGSAQKITPQQM